MSYIVEQLIAEIRGILQERLGTEDERDEFTKYQLKNDLLREACIQALQELSDKE